MPVDGENTPTFISRDRKTNDIFAVKVDDVFIPKTVKNITLDEREINDLREGRAVKIEGLISDKGGEIAQVVGAHEKHSGHMRGGGYIVTWALGTLLDFSPPEAYGKRRGAELPLIPKTSSLSSAKADWLVGMNANCALAKAVGIAGSSLGRAQTPTLAIIAARYLEHRHFLSSKYWTLSVMLDRGGSLRRFQLADRITEQKQAETIAARLKDGSTPLIEGFHGKADKTFAASLTFDKNFNLTFTPPEREK